MKITVKQKLEIAKVAEKFQLKLMVVFGSFANGKQREDSDLDIGVLGLEEISFKEQISLMSELAVIFNKEIDLSVLNRTNPLLLFQVSKNSVLLFGKQEDLLKFKLYAFKSYHDYAPYFAMENALNKKIINTYAS